MPEYSFEISGQVVHTDMVAVGTMAPNQCDDSGNIYLRPITGAGSAFQEPVVKLDGQGHLTRFSPAIPGMPKDFYVFAFTASQGRLYEFVMGTDEETKEGLQYLVAFTADGDYMWKSPVKPLMRPTVFLSLPSGDFLIAGVRIEKEYKGKGVIGLFGRDGELKRSLKSQGDDPEPGKKANPSTQKVEWTNPTIELAEAKLGGDGYIYFRRGSSPPVIQVLDTTGELVKALTLMEPFPQAEVNEFWVSGGRLFVAYQGPTTKDEKGKPHVRTLFSLYDAGSGELLANYASKSGGSVVCFDARDITELTVAPDGRFAIAHAPLQ